MSNLPIFFCKGQFHEGAVLSLPEDVVRHVVQVLRLDVADTIVLNNGIGGEALVKIVEIAKKQCSVKIERVQQHQQRKQRLHLAVAFTRNTSRNEWLLEKATELGVASIIPLIVKRSIKERFREDRAMSIIQSALVQSQQFFLPQLTAPMPLGAVYNHFKDVPLKLMAHCEDVFERAPLSQSIPDDVMDCLVMIGPEGDFTKEEIQEAYNIGVRGVVLCTQRLRTETAAMAACSYFNLKFGL